MTTLTLKYSLCSVVLGVALLGPMPAQADAEKEVIAAARALIEAANAGARAPMKKLQVYHSAFNADGGLLNMPRDNDETTSTEGEEWVVTWKEHLRGFRGCSQDSRARVPNTRWVYFDLTLKPDPFGHSNVHFVHWQWHISKMSRCSGAVFTLRREPGMKD